MVRALRNSGRAVVSRSHRFPCSSRPATSCCCLISHSWTMSSTRRGHLTAPVVRGASLRQSPDGVLRRGQEGLVGCGDRCLVCGTRLLRRCRSTESYVDCGVISATKQTSGRHDIDLAVDIADDRCRWTTPALARHPPLLPANTGSRDSFARTQRSRRHIEPVPVLEHISLDFMSESAPAEIVRHAFWTLGHKSPLIRYRAASAGGQVPTFPSAAARGDPHNRRSLRRSDAATCDTAGDRLLYTETCVSLSVVNGVRASPASSTDAFRQDGP
jgi:hypothetical protein